MSQPQNLPAPSAEELAAVKQTLEALTPGPQRVWRSADQSSSTFLLVVGSLVLALAFVMHMKLGFVTFEKFGIAEFAVASGAAVVILCLGGLMRVFRLRAALEAERELRRLGIDLIRRRAGLADRAAPHAQTAHDGIPAPGKVAVPTLAGEADEPTTEA